MFMGKLIFSTTEDPPKKNNSLPMSLQILLFSTGTIQTCIYLASLSLSILPYPTLPYPTLPYPTPSHPIPSHPIQPIPSHPIPSHPIPSHPIYLSICTNAQSSIGFRTKWDILPMAMGTSPDKMGLEPTTGKEITSRYVWR